MTEREGLTWRRLSKLSLFETDAGLIPSMSDRRGIFVGWYSAARKEIQTLLCWRMRKRRGCRPSLSTLWLQVVGVHLDSLQKKERMFVATFTILDDRCWMIMPSSSKLPLSTDPEEGGADYHCRHYQSRWAYSSRCSSARCNNKPQIRRSQ